MILSTTIISFKDRIAPLLLLILVCLNPYQSAIASDDLLLGDWVLDKPSSDNLKKKLKGQFRRRLPMSKFNRPISGGRTRGTAGDESQSNYWRTLKEGKERKAAKNIKRVGTAYPLISAKTLNITSKEKNYLFLYDILLPREIKPNASGRIYSAKGEELVEDSIGHTLAYWKNQSLILETTNTMGGTYLEVVTLRAPDELLYTITLDLRLLLEPITIKRVFRRKK